MTVKNKKQLSAEQLEELFKVLKGRIEKKH